MFNQKYIVIFVAVVAVLFVFAVLLRQNDTSSQEDPVAATEEQNEEVSDELNEDAMETHNEETTEETSTISSSGRPVKVVGSEDLGPIPESEILSGGPGKDGIPSIDDPEFVSIKEADFLDDGDIGMGIVVGDDIRFYPFQVLVWHEIVNDTVGGIPLAVTYCPLCRTGVTYERRLNGETIEFGVSGLLWKSNLLMYNRTNDPEDESLWSQVLGRAVLGAHTGTRLAIYPSDTVLYGDWKEKYPDTKVLSRDTGHFRLYGTDPYGNYYTNRDVAFGASFKDERLHPKEYVLGVEHNGQFKAYVVDALPVGTTRDEFAGQTVTIEKSAAGEVRMFLGSNPLPFIGGFWFSWVEVHPETELWNS